MRERWKERDRVREIEREKIGKSAILSNCRSKLNREQGNCI